MLFFMISGYFVLVFVFGLIAPAMTFDGNATYYETNNQPTACGRSYDNAAVIVALSAAHWTGSDTNHDPICDKAISVTDPISGAGFSLTVLIEDRCGGCRKEDLDLSRAAFEKFHSVDVGIFAVKWDFVGRTGK